jgi:Fic family protein
MHRYRESHPWITFQLDIGCLSWHTWLLVGEALSKCQHISGTPLSPDVAKEFHGIYLTKGAHATTQIEGNSLSEEEVGKRVRHELDLPPSREYLGVEVDNVLEGYNLIYKHVALGNNEPLTPERIKRFNEIVLNDLPLEEDVVPGEVRTKSVIVGGGTYRGAPAADCEYLLKELCDWIARVNEDVKGRDERQAMSVLMSIVAHLYIAWIHPFWDGNGRTGRLIEFQLLVQAGIPVVSAHLLSDYYNKTRLLYYKELAATSRKQRGRDGQPTYRIEQFIHYALQGFVDGLREQIERVRQYQLEVTWVNLVHERFKDMDDTKARQRCKRLILSLPHEWIPRRDLHSDPRWASLYMNSSEKTVSRDINRAVELGLLEKRGRQIRPRVNQVEAFLPIRMDPDEE